MTRMSSSTRPAHGVVVREAVAGDAEGIGRVRHAAWQVAYSGLMPADYLAGLSVDGFVLSARRMLVDRAARRVAVLVAEVGGVVSGFASVGPSRDADESEGSVGELYAIYVDPAMWRLGVGARLQDVALRRLRDEGYREATLWVLATNGASRAFYEHTGWRHDGGVSGFEAGAEVLDETRYRRTL
ncbi:GCN5-related N-acetyltransferase [Catenulispora acidiphila DSM 44928]|uniref:GCN5-related N-acetyltransferase n=2 Tax=Catenulispora TaxID=414878 RepID=C7PX08_CATAD|nr:GCN5-related N-acetyltransferase [Catenulispora acidiphila DSM 44928]